MPEVNDSTTVLGDGAIASVEESTTTTEPTIVEDLTAGEVIAAEDVLSSEPPAAA